MFRVKICGITSVEDAQHAANAGADAIGLNFVPTSPRYLSPQQAATIAAAVPPGVLRIGVFVNAPLQEVRETAQRLVLDAVQLHGEEPPEQLAELAPIRVLRAFRLGPDGLAPIHNYLSAARKLSAEPWAILVDGYSAAAHGGTGVRADWTLVHQLVHSPGVPPVVLAGGLTAENVALAIRTAGPAAVDVASGVESAPGQKDPDQVVRFVRAARSTLNQPNP